MKRYVQTIPKEGKIVFLDSGWMDEVVRQRQQKTIDSGEYELRCKAPRCLSGSWWPTGISW